MALPPHKFLCDNPIYAKIEMNWRRSSVDPSALADVAQWIEQSRPKGEVVSSTLTIGTYFRRAPRAIPSYGRGWRFDSTRRYTAKEMVTILSNATKPPFLNKAS